MVLSHKEVLLESIDAIINERDYYEVVNN